MTIASLDDGCSQFLSKKAGVDQGYTDFCQVDMAIPKHLDDAMGAYMEQTGGPPDLHE